MTFKTAPLAEGLGFGAVVTDLTREMIADPDTRQALYDLWIDKGVLVFRGLPDDPDTQIELSRIYGHADVHPLKFAGQGEIEELADIHYRPERGDIVRLPDGRRLGAWLPWHFDLAYVQRINHGGILRAKTLPQDGGRTGFIDGIDGYQRLPQDLRDEIADLWVVYRFDGDLAGLRYGGTPGLVLERMNVGSQLVMDRLDQLPPVAHPLVYRQADTGREVLNFSPWFALGIEGMEQDKADRILTRVTEYLVDERGAYFHQWQVGDMVLWDNWRIMHCATGIPLDQTRHMQRTTITGDYGLGRLADWPAGQVKAA